MARPRAARRASRVSPRLLSTAAVPEAAEAAAFGTLTADHRELRDTSRAFFMDHFHGLNERMDNEDYWPADAWPTIGKQGYLGLTVPPEYGGAGLDFLSAGMIGESLGYANPSLGLSHSAHDNLCANNIYLNGTEEQRARYLPGLCDGSAVGALGMSEPGAGSDALGSMRTTATRSADGSHYVLNGTKIWITNGPVADVMLVYAKTDPGRRNQGISAFLVESTFPGFSVAQKLDKMGFRGSPLGELVFEDCAVPAENLLGAENAGAAVMMSGLDLERAWVSVGATGAAQRALDLALEYAQHRRQFDQPIASFQLIQDKLARMYTALEAARGLVYRALDACQRVEAGQAGRGEIHALCAAAFLNSAEACTLCTSEAVQIFGGMGYMRDTEVNRLFRSAKAGEIAGGSAEIRKLIIAQELLKK